MKAKGTKGFSLRVVALAASALLAGGASAYGQGCGLCARQVTMNAGLATCFLSAYEALAGRASNTVTVDLSDCEETERGIVEALPMPSARSFALDREFILSRVQLGCLKRKLEEPGVDLDPMATIALDACQ